MPGRGAADALIVFERATVTTDDYGGEVRTWGEICSEWAQVNYGKGEERRSAAQENASLTATFRVLDNADTRSVTTKDRVQFDDAAWDIASNVPFGRANRDITATRPA